MESPGTGVTDACKLPWGFWKLDLGPLKKEPGLLLTMQCLQALKQYITGHMSQFCYKSYILVPARCKFIGYLPL